MRFGIVFVGILIFSASSAGLDRASLQALASVESPTRPPPDGGALRSTDAAENDDGVPGECITTVTAARDTHRHNDRAHTVTTAAAERPGDAILNFAASVVFPRGNLLSASARL